ncbi:MAG: YbhN family protein [Gemmatimonadaceae bacterium]
MKLDWRGALGIALSALLLWYLLRDHFGDVVGVLRTSDRMLWLLTAAAATTIFPLRARRWQAILAPLAGRLPFGPLWRATAIGMMVNNVFPLRAGEFARAFVLSRERKEVPFAAGFASLAVDRLFDGVVVLLLMVAATFDPRFPADANIWGIPASRIAFSAAGFLGVVGVGLYALVFFPHFVFRVAETILGGISPKLADKVIGLMTTFASGLGMLRSPRLALEVFWWALLHWLVNAFAFYLAFNALGIEAPFSAALFVQGIVVVGVALPSSPGFFGVFEGAAKVGLMLYGVSDSLALGWGIGFHIFSFVPITLIGGWYFSRMNLHLSDIAASKQAAEALTADDARHAPDASNRTR